mmetsp:Transcript_104767/g.165372  ORF Transcript_104767/g.165372 Transcript_104767/m.165372 type:complete len:211 (+) Transcript_104767:13-645(+)
MTSHTRRPLGTKPEILALFIMVRFCISKTIYQVADFKKNHHEKNQQRHEVRVLDLEITTKPGQCFVKARQTNPLVSCVSRAISLAQTHRIFLGQRHRIKASSSMARRWLHFFASVPAILLVTDALSQVVSSRTRRRKMELVLPIANQKLHISAGGERKVPRPGLAFPMFLVLLPTHSFHVPRTPNPHRKSISEDCRLLGKTRLCHSCRQN